MNGIEYDLIWKNHGEGVAEVLERGRKVNSLGTVPLQDKEATCPLPSLTERSQSLLNI